MSLTKAELEEIVANGTGQQQLDAVALLEKLNQKASAAKSKPLEPWESDETGCSLMDVESLASDFNAEADPEFRKKLFAFARQRYPRFAEKFTEQELARKPDPTAEEVAADYARRVAVHSSYDPKCRIPTPAERDANLRQLRAQTHRRMLRWAADPTGSLIGITHSVTGD